MLCKWGSDSLARWLNFPSGTCACSLQPWDKSVLRLQCSVQGMIILLCDTPTCLCEQLWAALLVTVEISALPLASRTHPKLGLTKLEKPTKHGVGVAW